MELGSLLQFRVTEMGIRPLSERFFLLFYTGAWVDA